MDCSHPGFPARMALDLFSLHEPGLLLNVEIPPATPALLRARQPGATAMARLVRNRTKGSELELHSGCWIATYDRLLCGSAGLDSGHPLPLLPGRIPEGTHIDQLVVPQPMRPSGRLGQALGFPGERSAHDPRPTHAVAARSLATGNYKALNAKGLAIDFFPMP